MEDKYMQMIIEATQSVKSAHHRIDKMEEDIGEIKELTIAVKEIAMETRANREDVNKISERLETIEQKPVKNWDKVVSTIIGTSVGAIVGAILGLIF